MIRKKMTSKMWRVRYRKLNRKYKSIKCLWMSLCKNFKVNASRWSLIINPFQWERVNYINLKHKRTRLFTQLTRLIIKGILIKKIWTLGMVRIVQATQAKNQGKIFTSTVPIPDSTKIKILVLIIRDKAQREVKRQAQLIDSPPTKPNPLVSLCLLKILQLRIPHHPRHTKGERAWNQ